MVMYNVIDKKKKGGELTREETEYFINGYVNGDIPDYQVSARSEERRVGKECRL